MERKSCCSGSRCVSIIQRVATPVKMPKKEEDVKQVQPSVKKEDLKPVRQDVKKEAAVVEATATATAAEVKGVKSVAKETVASATVKKEEELVKVNAGCGGGIGGGGCA